MWQRLHFSWNSAFYPIIIQFPLDFFPSNCTFQLKALLSSILFLKMSLGCFLRYITVHLTLIHFPRARIYFLCTETSTITKKKTVWPPAAAVPCFSQIPWQAQSTRGINNNFPKFVQPQHVHRQDLVMFHFYGKYIKLSDSKIQYLDYSLSFGKCSMTSPPFILFLLFCYH